jgi:hypothetical protein
MRLLVLKSFIFFAFWLVSALCSAALAVENGSVPYKSVNKILTLIHVHAKSPYTGLIAKVESEIEGVSKADIELSIIHKGSLIGKVSADNHGSVQFPLLEQEIGNSATIHINQPKGSVSMNLNAGVTRIHSHQVLYDDLFSVLDDLDKIANEMIGLPSWMLPDFDYLEFHFDSESTMTLSGVGIKQVYESNADHLIKLTRNEDFKASKVTIKFSQLPTETTFL